MSGVDEADLKLLGELLGILLLGVLLALDLWRGRSRRATVTMVGGAALLFLAFSGLVIARFVIIAR